MAGSESKVSPEQQRLRAATERLGDWIAPIIAFVAVSAMLFAVVWILLSPAE